MARERRSCGPLHLHKGLSGAYTASLAVVPTCAGEYRFVRVVPVLIFPGGPSCVGFVLPWLMPTRPELRSPDAAWTSLQVARRCRKGLLRRLSAKAIAGPAPSSGSRPTKNLAACAWLRGITCLIIR
jgi:hypothetical protein